MLSHDLYVQAVAFSRNSAGYFVGICVFPQRPQREPPPAHPSWPRSPPVPPRLRPRPPRSSRETMQRVTAEGRGGYKSRAHGPYRPFRPGAGTEWWVLPAVVPPGVRPRNPSGIGAIPPLAAARLRSRRAKASAGGDAGPISGLGRGRHRGRARPCLGDAGRGLLCAWGCGWLGGATRTRGGICCPFFFVGRWREVGSSLDSCRQ